MSRPELWRSLGALCEVPHPGHSALIEALSLPGAPEPADHTELFVFQLPPYGSLYLGAEGMLGGEARDRVAGFWRATGWEPPAECDHLATLLSLYATLEEAAATESEPARRTLREEAARALLWEHLLSWLPAYLEAVGSVAPPFYRAWAALLDGALGEAAELAGPPRALPLHLREAPPLPFPNEGARQFLAGLLTPVRSGLILARADLARGAAELGIGVRLSERNRVLSDMVALDPASSLAWLAAEAASWADRHRRREELLGEVARFWRVRAETSRQVLLEAV